MIAKEVAYATQIVTISGGTKKYVRLNVSNHTVGRNSDETVFANVQSGKLRIVAKDANVTPVAASA